MAKRALLIGCNYPGTKAELHGCVNDVNRMYKCLVDRFGFDENDITVMVDTDKRSVQPTGVNIKKVLTTLIHESVRGDILVLHYSGHGTQVPAESGDADDDGLDEAIVPTDLNLLTDDDFRLLFNKIQHGVSFTFISDSCHSGGLIDHEKEQIGAGVGDRGFAAPVPAQSRAATRSYDAGHGRESAQYGRREEPEYGREERRGHHGRREEPEYGRQERHGHHGRRAEYEEEEPRRERYGHGRRDEYEEPSRERYGRREEGDNYDSRVNFVNKSLSIETLTQMLSDQTGHEVKPGNIRTSLYDMFGEDASPTVKVFVNLIASRLGGNSSEAQGGGGGGGVWGAIGGLAVDFLKTKLNDSHSGTSLPASVVSSAVSQSGHAGRKPPASERVADDVGILISGCQSNETSADANPTGDPAQAYGALSNGIQTILAQRDGPISNGDLVREVRAMLKKQGFSQHPCLYSSDENVNATFIC